jgi:hypothetical protein
MLQVARLSRSITVQFGDDGPRKYHLFHVRTIPLQRMTTDHSSRNPGNATVFVYCMLAEPLAGLRTPVPWQYQNNNYRGLQYSTQPSFYTKEDDRRQINNTVLFLEIVEEMSRSAKEDGCVSDRPIQYLVDRPVQSQDTVYSTVVRHY